jgi:peptide/nickel transport system substrate-binding protein
MAIFAQSVTGLIPGLCSTLCTQNIPTPSNQYTGNNTTRTAIPAADKLLQEVDNNLNDSVRMASAKKADDILANVDASLPLDPLPDILIWSNKVVGPVVDNPIEGMFWNIDQWGIKQ